MFRNYLKVAIRNILKNKSHAAINIIGLAVGFAASILIFLYARNELTYDAFHKNAQSIYQVYKERITPTGTQITRDTWVPLAKALKDEYPGIINTARIWEDDGWVVVDDRKFKEKIDYCDSSFLQIFTFPLKYGNPVTALSQLNSAVITTDISEKYFGDENPIGKNFTLDYKTDYTVTGVLEPIPQNSNFDIDILLPAESAPYYERLKENWGRSFIYTYIQLDERTTRKNLEALFPRLVEKIWTDKVTTSTMNLKLTPLMDLYNEETGANKYAFILIGIAFAVLLIAAINFMNLSTARSLERAKEIGIRKVLGAFRSQLVKQFLSESLFMTILAFFLALGLVQLILPLFNLYYEMNLALNYSSELQIIGALIGLAIGVGIISGAYPALLISRYKLGESLKGKLHSKSAGIHLRYALVIVQFCLAISLMIGTGIMWQQVQYMQDADLNFERENQLVIPMRASDFDSREESKTRMEAFRNELLQHSGIRSVAFSTHVPGNWAGWFTFAYPTDRDDSQRLRLRRCIVDENYFETYGIEFVEGRNFSSDLTTDAEESMIINEAALRDIGWHSAESHQIKVGSNVYNVVGVVKDYNFQSLANKVAPVLHFYRPAASPAHRLVTVKLAAGQIAPTLDFIKTRLAEIDPARTFEFTFVDDQFNRLYQAENRLTTVISSFAILAILIACLGLFGLASLMVTQRTKEIGIRKTLGATIASIVLLFTRIFTQLVGAAFLIACPLAYAAGNAWLQDFAFRTDISFGNFVFAGLIALVIAFLAVSYHALKAAAANPVDAMKYE